MTDRFKLLVFDWDGTVMDSAPRIVACIRAAIQDLGLEARSEGAIRNIIGLGLREAIDTLFPGQDDGFHQRFTDCYRHYFLGADPTPAVLFPSADTVLQTLHEEGYLLAVATGKGRRGLDKVLEESGLRELFHVTRCADETRSKPHPQMLLEIMDELAVAPEHTLMIGDTEYDMEMANNAQAFALAVTYGVHERARLLRHNPLGSVDAISELPGWLRQGRGASAAAFPGLGQAATGG